MRCNQVMNNLLFLRDYFTVRWSKLLFDKERIWMPIITLAMNLIPTGAYLRKASAKNATSLPHCRLPIGGNLGEYSRLQLRVLLDYTHPQRDAKLD